MATQRKYKSDAFEAIHSSASALLSVGAIDKASMRDFDLSCLSADVKQQQVTATANTGVLHYVQDDEHFGPASVAKT